MSAPALDPKTDFAIMVARRDLEGAEQLDVANATRGDVLAHLGAVTSSLRNVLGAVDALTGAEVTP